MSETARARILVVDDESAIRGVLSASLTDEGYVVDTAADGIEAGQKIESFKPNIVLLDIWMPGEFDGLEVLRRWRPQAPNTHFIMMSGHGTIETAVKATKFGAWDFVEKPLSMDKISILISNIFSFQSERDEKIALLNKLRRNIAMVGDGPAMKELKQVVARVSASHASVLITGENGAGKELLAQNIHYLSPRASRPFVDVNCAAIPHELNETELFGHEKGAFVGIDKEKKGKFDYASGGTIFLDDVSDLSPSAQEKLLAYLQNKKFQRAGGSTDVSVDVRVIAASNKNLEEEVKAGRFNEILYRHLSVVPINVPALRYRAEDIPALVAHFGEQFSREGGYSRKTFTEQALDKMRAYPWTGNVRELRNFVERIYILIGSDVVDKNDLRIAGLMDTALTGTTESSFRRARAEFEKEFLLQKISENGGNISKTAEAIGLERSYLHRKIKSYGIEV